MHAYINLCNREVERARGNEHMNIREQGPLSVGSQKLRVKEKGGQEAQHAS